MSEIFLLGKLQKLRNFFQFAGASDALVGKLDTRLAHGF